MTQTLVSYLAPAHVGEEDQEQGDGEQGLVQHSLEGDQAHSVGHRVPRVQPAVPSYRVSHNNSRKKQFIIQGLSQ